MKLFNGWEIFVRYNGDPLRDMYAKRFSIYLIKDKEYIPTEAEEKFEMGKTYVPLIKNPQVTVVD